MKKSITPKQIKQNNRQLIYQMIYRSGRVSQQDIAYDLRLSRPTVATNLTELENAGYIEKSGQIDSELVGRKAAAYAVVADFRISIGVEIRRREIKVLAIDLYGRKIKRMVAEIEYENTDAYYQRVSAEILSFINGIKTSDEQILGVGFAMQGLISPDRETVIYGKILGYTGLSVHVFQRHIPYPCMFNHDSNCAATSELWVSPELHDAFYLSLSTHLGAAIISNREILTGKHGHSATVEHVQLRPDGKHCYCGKQGCIETLCSMDALLADGEEPDDFFDQVRRQETEAAVRWRTYLQNLAEAINYLHLIYDTDFVLGGYLAPYLKESDIQRLYELIREMTPFEEESDFISVSKMPEHNITIGAALPYVQHFLDQPL